jgi:hypothetical protein
MKTRVSQCLHRHLTDIDPQREMDSKEWDRQANICIVRATTALHDELAGYSKEQRDHISDMFNSMAATNRAIRQLLGPGWGDPSSVDAVALARLQLEGLFALCLMFESPKYVDRFRQDYWRKSYIQYLLIREETLTLPSFQELASKTPVDLLRLGLHFGVTNAPICTVENEELGKPLPHGVRKEPITRFPTPGKAIDLIPQGDKRPILERLYQKYLHLCSFAHGSGEANLFKIMFDERSPHARFATDNERAERFQSNVAGEAFTTSFFSIAQAAAELTASYPKSTDLPGAAIIAWDQLSVASFWTKAVWEIRTRNLLGAIR